MFDSEGLRSPASRAQRLLSPSPQPLGHTVSVMHGLIFAIFCFAEEVPMRYNALESSGISMAAA